MSKDDAQLNAISKKIDPAFQKTLVTATQPDKVKAAYAVIEPLCHPMTLVIDRASSVVFDGIVQSMKLKGFNPNKPILRDGKVIIDGRTRAAAAYYVWGDEWEKHVKFRAPSKDEADDVVSTVVQENLSRRHLDPQQRAFIAARMLIGDLPCELPADADGRVRLQVATMCSVNERQVEDAKAGLLALRYVEMNPPSDPAQKKELDAIKLAVTEKNVAPYGLKVRATKLKKGTVHVPRRGASNTASAVDSANADPFAGCDFYTPEQIVALVGDVSKVLQGSLARVPTKGQNTWLKLLTKAAIERTLKDAALLLENQRDGKPKTAVEMEKPATVKVTKGKGKAKAA